jgi:hypothetical protein
MKSHRGRHEATRQVKFGMLFCERSFGNEGARMAVLRRLLRGLHAIAPDGNELASKPVALRHAHYCFKQWEANSLKVAYSGLKFFYAHTCPREWPTRSKLRVPKQVKLPTVLMIPEVQLIGAVGTWRRMSSAWRSARMAWAE